MKGARYARGLPRGFIHAVLHELPFASWTAAHEFYAGCASEPAFGGSQDEAFLAANDRYYLLTTVLRRHDAIHEWVYDRAREVEAEPDEHLDLWSRAHYKSTLITFAGSIQEIIDDPEITIAIFGNTSDVSQPFLEQIMRECEENEHLKNLYPDVFWREPRTEAPVWSKQSGMVVKRKSNPKELTVQAFGLMEALPTGGHWRLRIYNDIVTLKSVTTTNTDQIGKTVIRWEMSQNLGTYQGGRRWVEGTRYHFADAYGVIMDRRSLIPRIYPATEDGTLNGKPVFLSEEEWEKIKRDQRSVVAAQMLLNPLAGQANTFFVDYLRPYEIRPREMNVYIIGDPAGRPSAKSDNTAMVVIGIDAGSNRYLLDGYCHKMRLSEKYDNLSGLERKWKNAPEVQSVKVFWEKYGMQTDLEYFEERSFADKEKGMQQPEEVGWTREGGQSKVARISRLEPYFRNSQFWLPPKVWHPDLGVCTWKVEKKTEALMHDDEPVRDKKTGAIVMVDVDGSAEVVYTPYKAPSRAEVQAKARGELFRVMEPIKRLDHDGSVYDLTRRLFEEYRLHPFAPHDDLIDALSRIQDVQPTPPQAKERAIIEGPAFADT